MFISHLQPRASGADDRSPWGDWWFQPISWNSGAGVRVTPDSALTLTAVYACVRLLSQTFASLPFVLYRKKAGGGKEVVTDHWLYRLLARRPNDWQNAFEWREMVMGHLALRGNAFNVIMVNPRGEIEQLVPLHPDRVKIEMLSTGSWRYRVRQADGSDKLYGRGEIWHLRGLSSDGIVGLSPIDLMREAVSVGLAAQTHGARFFANDARPGGWIEHPNNFKDKSSRETWRSSWQQQQSGANRGKTAVLEFGMKYHEVGVNNADAQFLETRKLQVTEIARGFGVPPHLIADLDRSTNNNIEHQGMEFITYCMAPWAERWEASIEADLLLEGLNEGLEVEHDFAGLMRGDSKARSEYYASGIVNGWLVRNEARVAENLDPIDGLDDPLMPLNMQVVGAPPAAGLLPPLRQPVPSDDGAGEDAAGRLQHLARAAAERVARKEAAVLAPLLESLPQPVDEIVIALDKHAQFVRAALGIGADEVQRYIEARQLDPVRAGRVTEDVYQAALNRLLPLALKGTA